MENANSSPLLVAIKHIWKGKPFWDFLWRFRNHSFLDCAHALRHILDKHEFELFVTAAWAVWKEVCKIKHQQVKVLSLPTIDWTTSFLEEFQKACRAVCSTPIHAKENDIRCWKKPSDGQLRLDVDACFNETKGNFSVGAIVRDCEGKILAALAKKIRHPGSVLGAELQAITSGLLFCRDNDFHNIQIFTDSLMAVQAVTRPLEYFGPLESSIADVNELLRSCSSIGIFHMYRSANKAAHCLASFVLSSSSPYVWVEDGFPNWLEEIVLADVSASSN